MDQADEYRIIISETDVPDTLSHTENLDRRVLPTRFPFYTLQGLKPGTQYAMHVAGMRNGNKGKAHPYIFEWTVPNAVDATSVTTNTRVDSRANHQVDIYFDPPNVGGHDKFKLSLFEKDGEYFEERVVEKAKILGTGSENGNVR